MKFFTLLCLFFLTACSQGSNLNNNHYANDPVRHDGTLPKATHAPSHIKINPNRKEHYQATIKITDAPIQFNFAKGFESYTARNCRYVTNAFAGSQGNPEFTQKFTIHKTDNNIYTADFYTDTPLDEDYYGNGLCHWQSDGSVIYLKPTGSNIRETRLAIYLESEILKKISTNNQSEYIVNKYKKEDFPMVPYANKFSDNELQGSPGFHSIEINEETMQELHIQPEQVFTVEIWIKKVIK